MFNKRRFSTTAILVAILLLPSISIAAQAAASDWSRLNSIQSGTKLSIRLKNGKSVQGRLHGVSDSTLTISVKKAMQDIKREDIQTIHRVVRKSATKATLIGTGVGAGAGAVAGAVGGDDSNFDTLDKAATAALTVVGAGVGAIAGYLIGRSGGKKELIYEAR